MLDYLQGRAVLGWFHNMRPYVILSASINYIGQVFYKHLQTYPQTYLWLHPICMSETALFQDIHLLSQQFRYQI